MATLNVGVYTVHTSVSLGLLRNGPAEGVNRTARQSSVNPRFYYTGPRYSDALEGDAANLVPACPISVLLETNYRCAFSAIVASYVRDAQAAHAAAAGAGGAGIAFDEDAARAAASVNPTTKLEALAVGAVRTALVKSYQVTEADLRETESDACILTLVPPAGATNVAAYRTLLATPSAGWNVSLVSGDAEADANDEELSALNAPSLNADEVDLAFGLMSLGQVAPVRGGAQLFNDGHHYHSDPTASARHRANENEVMGRLGNEARNIWRANIMMFRNAVWHASIHPVREGVLIGFAEDNNIVGRLNSTGYGSFAIGLPAQEDLFQRANSYMAVLAQVSQTARSHGHTLSLDNLAGTVRALENVGRNGPFPPMRPALPGNPSGPWPAGCDTRAKALKSFLEPALVLAEPVAAWMFGFYKEICSRTSIRAASQEGSLLRSYSLKRSVANYLGEAARAQEMYSARARFIRRRGEEGHLETYDGSA